MPPLSRARAAIRFHRGLGALTDLEPAGPELARRQLTERRANRERTFLQILDEQILSRPGSPHATLLGWAGVERGDIVALLDGEGLEGALERLRDAGIYVRHEEWLGTESARRGSAETWFEPAEFANPHAPGDLLAGTSGTRSGGVPIAWTFRALARNAAAYVLRSRTWRVDGTPSAIWLPGQPSGVGLATALLLHAAEGASPERWFTPLPAAGSRIADRLSDRALVALARSRRIRIPSPASAPIGDPGPVLRWCESALRRSPRARLGAYTGSAVALAVAAREAGVSLEGLVIATLGEPLDAGRAAAIASSGAEAANAYGFMQLGTVAHGCPSLEPGQLHLLEHRAAVIPRRRPTPAGAEVEAFAWTGLDPLGPTVTLNTENDDFGRIERRTGCDCELGRIGFERVIGSIRGISKVSAEGMTLRSESFASLAHRALPEALGGGPTDFQFEQRRSGQRARIVLRIDPRLGPIDAERVRGVVEAELGRTGAGALAVGIWRQSGGIEIERSEAVAEAGGKLLPLRLAEPRSPLRRS